MQWTYVLIGLFSGVVLPIQAAINAQLRHSLSSPVVAALASFIVGTVALVMYAALTRTALPHPRLVDQAPWWAWLGGMLGALYVVAAILVTPKLGASALVAVTVTGQLIAALVIDHYGWLGLPLQPLSAARICGALLLMAGVLLMTRV
jgi:transporter family-2 protein